jgi:hypothetical protein
VPLPIVGRSRKVLGDGRLDNVYGQVFLRLRMPGSGSPCVV